MLAECLFPATPPALLLTKLCAMASRSRSSWCRETGAYPRPLFSSTRAVSDTKAHPKHP